MSSTKRIPPTTGGPVEGYAVVEIPTGGARGERAEAATLLRLWAAALWEPPLPPGLRSRHGRVPELPELHPEASAALEQIEQWARAILQARQRDGDALSWATVCRRRGPGGWLLELRWESPQTEGRRLQIDVQDEAGRLIVALGWSRGISSPGYLRVLGTPCFGS